MRFLIDENLPVSLTEMLRREGHDVVDIREADLRGASDDTIWRLAGHQQRVLLTRDLDFPLSGVHPQPKGLLLIRVPDTWVSRSIVNLVQECIQRLSQDQLERHITVLTPGQIRTHHMES